MSCLNKRYALEWVAGNDSIPGYAASQEQVKLIFGGNLETTTFIMQHIYYAFVRVCFDCIEHAGIGHGGNKLVVFCMDLFLVDSQKRRLSILWKTLNSLRYIC